MAALFETGRSTLTHRDNLEGNLRWKRHKHHHAGSSAVSKLCQQLKSSSLASQILRCGKRPSPDLTKYLPDLKHVRVKDRRGFEKWSEEFFAQQLSYCGSPETEIEFGDSRRFEEAAITSWPWMVSIFLFSFRKGRCRF